MAIGFDKKSEIGCRPSELAEVAYEFPVIRFNFAHCRPIDEMAKVIADCPNVWTDTAYMSIEDFPVSEELTFFA